MLREFQNETVEYIGKSTRNVESRAGIRFDSPPSRLDDLWQIFADSVADMLRQLRATPLAAQDWDGLQQVLASLPMTTDEFGKAKNRLLNASRYAKTGEFGAAQFELRLLPTSMARAT